MSFLKRIFVREPENTPADEAGSNAPAVCIHQMWLDAVAVRLEERNPTPIEYTKLIRDLEDIQRGGSDWRLSPLMRGHGRGLAVNGVERAPGDYVYVGAEPSPDESEFNDYGMRRIAAITAGNVIDTIERAAQGLKDRGSDEAIRAIFDVTAKARYPNGYLG